MITAISEKVMADNNNSDDATNDEIAAFAALVQSSSGENDDDDNASLVSLNDESVGLLTSDAHDEEKEGHDSLQLMDSALDSANPSLSVGDEDGDAEMYGRDRGRCRFLLARTKANPSLSIATVFMGMLTLYLWTDERFRFTMTSKHPPTPSNDNNSAIPRSHRTKGKDKNNAGTPKLYPAFPAKTLLGITVHEATSATLASVKGNDISQNPLVIEPPYNPTDFQYEKFGRNRTLLYWEEIVEAIEQSQSIQEEDGSNDYSLLPSNDSIVELWTNISTWGPCYPRALPEQHHRSLRAHKEKSSSTQTLDWASIVESNSDQITDEGSIDYPTYKKGFKSSGSFLSSSGETLGGLCRPGFLIIGQGKCGTSSLYHYLTGHPRILPAKEKQIHYFRYHKSKPLEWYYSHFPTIESFLGRGALMTGEASPGYMPYPDVVESVVKRLSPDWKPGGSGDGRDGAEAWKEHVRSLPKIIAIVRDPIARAVSSYKYNYVEPAMKKLRSGRGISASGKAIPGKKSDVYYRRFSLFSFEELALAELAMLKDCLKPGGRGERWSYDKFGKRSDMFFYDSMQRRNNSNDPTTAPADSDSSPLIHLDLACYVDTRSTGVPRVQWKDFADEHPDKILQLPNLQLTQSIVGRGAYVLSLEWWYEVFSNPVANTEEHIHVVCTEDMAETPEGAMGDLTEFLGLPEFDFANVTNVGRYNVGGHKGYDTVTKTHADGREDGGGTKEDGAALPHQDSSPGENDVGLLAVSDALRNELTHFYHPYNERLFRLIGKRCPWE